MKCRGFNTCRHGRTGAPGHEISIGERGWDACREQWKETGGGAQ